jgi:hypothetical protein
VLGGDGESSGTGLMTTMLGLGEGEAGQPVSGSQGEAVDMDGTGGGGGVVGGGVQCLRPQGDEFSSALTVTAPGWVGNESNPAPIRTATPAVILSRRLPRRGFGLMAMGGGRKYTRPHRCCVLPAVSVRCHLGMGNAHQRVLGVSVFGRQPVDESAWPGSEASG